MRKERKKLVIEILLILFISLFLAIIYNSVSPQGIEILPEKIMKKVRECIYYSGYV
jgi:hypothetical protein